MQAGRLRHRVAIEHEVVTQDPVTLERARVWRVFAAGVPAEVVPLSGREFVAAQAEQAGVTTRMTIRPLPGLTTAMRVRHLGVVHNIKAILPDPTFRSHVTLMCEAGVPAPAVPVDTGTLLLAEDGQPIQTEAGEPLEVE